MRYVRTLAARSSGDCAASGWGGNVAGLRLQSCNSVTE